MGAATPLSQPPPSYTRYAAPEDSYLHVKHPVDEKLYYED